MPAGIALEALPGYRLETLAENFHWPQAIAPQADGRVLVLERDGRLLRVSDLDNEPDVIRGLPAAATYGDHGGCVDLAPHPRFAQHPWVYLTCSVGTEQKNSLRLYAARVDDTRLVDVRALLDVAPYKTGRFQFGGRLLFIPDGSLLIGTGDGREHREQAQSLASEWGKVLRVNPLGEPAIANPYPQEGSERIWAHGLRNPRGMALAPGLGKVLLLDEGPRGGDEINVIESGANYGWPAVTDGVDFIGAHVSPFRRAPGIREPLWVWPESIGPAGLAWHAGHRYPGWARSILVATSSAGQLYRLEIPGQSITRIEPLLAGAGAAIADVSVDTDGEVLILTDGEAGRLLRLLPDTR